MIGIYKREKKEFGAGDESRTRDLNLGKVALYQLSYSRGEEDANSTESKSLVKHPAQIFAESTPIPFYFGHYFSGVKVLPRPFGTFIAIHFGL